MEPGAMVAIGSVVTLAAIAVAALLVAAYYRGGSKLEALQRAPVRGAKRPCRGCGHDIPPDWTVALREDTAGRMRVYHLHCLPEKLGRGDK